MAHKASKRGRGSAGQNRKASEDFLEKNRKKAGVQVSSSGLQYLIREEGSGPRPDPDSLVTINQRVTLIDGSVISDTYHTGLPETFRISEAIEGLKEGLVMMSVGSKYRFFVPPDLAWGKRGAGSKIGPYATLIFDIRLDAVDH